MQLNHVCNTSVVSIHSILLLKEVLPLLFLLFFQKQFPFGVPCVLKVSKFPGSLWWSKEERLFSVRFTLYYRPESVLLGLRWLTKLILCSHLKPSFRLVLKYVFRLCYISVEVPAIFVVLKITLPLLTVRFCHWITATT